MTPEPSPEQPVAYPVTALTIDGRPFGPGHVLATVASAEPPAGFDPEVTDTAHGVTPGHVVARYRNGLVRLGTAAQAATLACTQPPEAKPPPPPSPPDDPLQASPAEGQGPEGEPAPEETTQEGAEETAATHAEPDTEPPDPAEGGDPEALEPPYDRRGVTVADLQAEIDRRRDAGRPLDPGSGRKADLVAALEADDAAQN